MSGMDSTRLSLLERLRQPGDKDAWARFMNVYEPLLKGYVRSLNVPHADADDVVQNVMISLLRAMPTFSLDRDKGRFRTWLYRLTINAVRDRWRRAKTRSDVEVSWHPDLPEPGVVDPEPDAGWEEAYQKRMLQLALDEVRAATEERTWACFQKHKLENRGSEEVGAELGLTPEAVRKNASRTFKKVQERANELAQEHES